MTYTPVSYDDGWGIERDVDGTIIWSTTGDGYKQAEIARAVLSDIGYTQAQIDSILLVLGLLGWESRDGTVPDR